MKRHLRFFIPLICFSIHLQAQDTCISVMPLVCLGDCIDVDYVGSGSDTATYTWSSTCGIFDQPNQQDPGNHCFQFVGTCTLQVIVQEPGLSPDTCTITVEVVSNPDGQIDGDTTLCSGDCAPITIHFLSGSPPYTYQIDDGNITNIYTSFGTMDTFEVCPPFTTTYTLVSIVDGWGCNADGPFNDVTIVVTPDVVASIIQIENSLCANPPGQNYLWYDCDSMNILSVQACYEILEDGCYCVVVSDAATGMCVDTVCGEFMLPCDLSCEIIVNDTACIGEAVVFAYSGNASDSATFDWLIDLPGMPGTPFSGNDTVILAYSAAGCYQAMLTVTDSNCITMCMDSICIFESFSQVSFGPDTMACDTCIEIPITLSGVAPWTLYIFNGVNTDTISAIDTTLYYYTVCPPQDTTITFFLFNATDGLDMCPVAILDDSLQVTLYSTPTAVINQNGNELCAEPVNGSYAWYECGFAQLLTFDSCFVIADTGCFCLVVTNGFCSDTLCGEYLFNPCDLSCEVVLEANACVNDSVYFIYSGNASPSAFFNWLIDVPGFPMMPVTGNDTIAMLYDQAGCYHASVTVFDAGCVVSCSDSICIGEPMSEASICCNEEKCDSCTNLTITLTGPAPWTVHLSDGNLVDTITGIMTSPYVQTVCPPADSQVTYTLLQVTDSVGICPAQITDSAVTIVLHAFPEAAIMQDGDTLCAFPAGMAGYGWYSCPSGAYISTDSCFVPTASGCYCVDVSTAHDCVDTACIQFIISALPITETLPFRVYPNPFTDQIHVEFEKGFNEAWTWTLLNAMGETVGLGDGISGQAIFSKNTRLPSGMYILRVHVGKGQLYVIKLLHL